MNRNTQKLNLIYILLAIAAATFLALSIAVFDGGKPIWFSGIFATKIQPKFAEDSVLIPVFTAIITLISVISAYFVGCISFPDLIARHRHNDDIKKYGSKKSDLLNVFRVYGKADGRLCFLGDFIKIAFACFWGRFLGGEFCAYLAALFVVLGHIAPVTRKFRGGMSVIAIFTAILCTDVLYFAAVAVIYIAVYFCCHFLSMSAIVSAFFYPAAVFYGARIRSGGVSTAGVTEMIFAFFVLLFILIRYRENIKRVYYGDERKIYINLRRKK